ncbi:MAG: glycoside hydrolase family 28 protein [Bacteroidetes bacterium]|nr:MAG: glycoside hydrolase family 28 protein [Bacteroidota bacterium]
MKLKNLLLIALSILITSVSASNSKSGWPGEISTEVKTELNIVSFGAVGDGKTLNTPAIQKAIDEVSSKGGGTVIVPAGRFLTGAISLKTGVNLKLEFNSVILGSINPFDYIVDNKFMHFINADNASNIGITGEGTIDGRGRKLALVIDSLYFAGIWDDPSYNHRRHRPERRPKLLHFTQSNHIIIEGITAMNAANWVLDFDRCNHLTIDKVTVESDNYWNNDGMDIGDCRNVKITNCFVNSSDDGICLKSHHTGYLNDSIYIANCTVRSSASAIKFGTASLGGFRNVKIENINIFDTFRSAIALESVDGGILENIEISDITAINTGNAIFIKLGHRNSDGEVGTLKNVSIKNIVVQVPFGAPDLKYEIRGPELPFFHNTFPASITGLPGHYVENVNLENIRIIYPGRANNGYAHLPVHRLKDVPENESQYPEFSMFGELPSWGFYVRHVKGLSMKNINLKVLEYDFRPAFVFDDVKDLFLNRVKIEDEKKSEAVILRNVLNIKTDLEKENIKTVE